MEIEYIGATLTHEAWNAVEFYASEQEATRALLEYTQDYKEDDFTEEEWIDVCLEEGWCIENVVKPGHGPKTA